MPVISNVASSVVDALARRARAAAQPAANVVRDHAADGSVVFKRDQLVLESLRSTPDGMVVDRLGREEVWNARGTAATVDGQQLHPAAAPRVSGEAPRGPWKPRPNRFVFPDKEATAANLDPSKYAAFARKLDANQAAIGSRVLVPTPRQLETDPQATYNCHSYALTNKAGDPLDPFANPNVPHWVGSPWFELNNGHWQALAADQRAHVGDRLVYRNNGQITHTAVVSAVDKDGNPSRVRSKWGSWGLFEHDPFNVPNVAGTPSDYGLPAELYRPAK